LFHQERPQLILTDESSEARTLKEDDLMSKTERTSFTLLGVFLAVVCFSRGDSSLGIYDETYAHRWIPGVQEQTDTGIHCQRRAEDVIVFTANQGWLSRIYVLAMDGTVVTYYEYEYFIFSDVEVVNNELYVTDWVAPRLYRVDLTTGGLDVIVDDWSLISMYDVAFDGTYFYIDEWALNRYTLQGSHDSTVSFSENVRGSAWDGSYYWTLTTDNLIKCWDISSWPAISPVSENDFAPPSSQCRGLWFDGQYFWTAESIDGVLGYIYQFDHTGSISDQWLAPAFQGYAAGVIRDFLPNNPPDPPAAPSGPLLGYAGIDYAFRCATADPDGHQLWYQWDWGDEIGDWIGPYASGQVVSVPHGWDEPGVYSVRVKAIDDPNDDGDPSDGLESDWSNPKSFEVRNLGDVNGDGVVNVQDFLMILAQWGTPGPEGDVNNDGIVNVEDFLIVLANWTT
jgi:hypothetical protein